MARNRLTLFTFVTVTIFLGLAVLGWGGFKAFFDHPSFIALTAFCYIFSVIATFTAGNISSGEREDKSNRWVLGAFSVIALVIGFLPAYTDRIGFSVIHPEPVRWVGVALFVLGCVLRIWPVFVLGNRFSGLVAIQPGHTLVTDGIYRFIRNPSYLGMVVTVLGWGIVFRSWVGVLLAASLMIPLVPRMNSEEALLYSQFGKEYEAYRSRTWRMLPWVY